MRSPRGTDGFTVIELVIVMAILVIMVGIVAPRMQVSASRRVGHGLPDGGAPGDGSQ